MKNKLRFAGRVSRDVLALVGAGALVAFYSSEGSAWWLAIATVLCAGMGYLAWRIRAAVEQRTTLRRARFSKPQLLVPTKLAVGAPPMRRVHVGFNPDTGAEITKLEAVGWN